MFSWLRPDTIKASPLRVWLSLGVTRHANQGQAQAMKALVAMFGMIAAMTSSVQAADEVGKHRSDRFANSCRKAVELDQGRLSESPRLS